MDKNKMFRWLRDRYTDKQIEEIMEGKEIANVWEEKEKKVKKTWNKDKKEYNVNVLRCNEKEDEKF